MTLLFGGLPQHHPPFVSAFDINLSEIPVVLHFAVAHFSDPKQFAGDDSGIAIDSRREIACFVAKKFDMTAPQHGERVRFSDRLHFRDDNSEVIVPEFIQCIGVAGELRVVPGFFEARQCGLACCG